MDLEEILGLVLKLETVMSDKNRETFKRKIEELIASLEDDNPDKKMLKKLLDKSNSRILEKVFNIFNNLSLVSDNLAYYAKLEKDIGTKLYEFSKDKKIDEIVYEFKKLYPDDKIITEGIEQGKQANEIIKMMPQPLSEYYQLSGIIPIDIIKITRLINNHIIYEHIRAKNVKFLPGLNIDLFIDNNEHDFKQILKSFDPQYPISLKEFSEHLIVAEDKLKKIVEEQASSNIFLTYPLLNDINNKGKIMHRKYKPGIIISNLNDWVMENKIVEIEKRLDAIQYDYQQRRSEYISFKDYYSMVGTATKHLHPGFFDTYSLKANLLWGYMNVLELDILKLSNVKILNLDIINIQGKYTKEHNFDKLPITLETPQNPYGVYKNAAGKIYDGLSAIYCLNACIEFYNLRNGTSNPKIPIDLNKKIDIRVFLFKSVIDNQKEFLRLMNIARVNEEKLISKIASLNKKTTEHLTQLRESFIKKKQNYDRINKKLDYGSTLSWNPDQAHAKAIERIKKVVDYFDNFERYYNEFYDVLEQLKYLNKYLKYKAKYISLKQKIN